MANKCKPRTLYNTKTRQTKSFQSGGAARRAIELDPNWSWTPPGDSTPAWWIRFWRWFLRN